MKHLFYLLSCCFLIWSCSSGGNDEPTPAPKPQETPVINITSATTIPAMEQKGGTTEIEFTTNAAWTVSVSENRAVDWVSVSPTSGQAGTHTLNITTTANDTYDERNASITLKAGTTTKSITIAQKQKNALLVTSNKVQISAAGGEATIEVNANVDYQFEIEESAKSWITQSASRALKTTTLSLQIAENEGMEKREGKVIIKSGELSEEVTIYQEGNTPTIVLTQNEYTVGSNGETIQIELKSNVEYTVQLPAEGWITEVSSRAFSMHTRYFNIAPNDTYDARTAIIAFVNKENDIEEKVTVTQIQQDAMIVAKSEYTIGSEGGALDFTVNTNVDFTVSVSADWIKQITSRGLKEKALYFDVTENTSEETREATITLVAEKLKQVIIVRQTKNTDFDSGIDDLPTEEW